jgi:hypothetical protein
LIDSSQVSVTLRLSLAEIAHISIALDEAVGRDHRLMQPEHVKVRDKWDSLYRAIHKTRALGVQEVSLS